MVIDLQVHFWEDYSEKHPHLDISNPNLPYPFGPAQMLPLMKDAGVDHAVIVPPGFMGADNEYALDCAKDYPESFSVMGLIDISSDNLLNQLETWLDQKGMIGIRTHLSKRMRDRWPNARSGNILWELCSNFSIPVAVFASEEVKYLQNILVQYPNLKLIIDHFGLPPIDITRKNGIDEQNLADILALSKFENVYIKTSTLPVRSHAGYPFDDMKQVVKMAYNAFGPQRMLWATDFTQSLSRSTSTYKEEIYFWQFTMPFLKDEDIDWILDKSAREFFPHLSLLNN